MKSTISVPNTDLFPEIPATGTPYVRRNVNSLLPNGLEMTSLRKGVKTMQARPADDPTSWIYQANIHGTNQQPELPTWNKCQHGSFFFFSWHRMYLYWFERILRAASGDPTLSIPYWDYSNPAQRALPLAFRSPQDATNPLYIAAPQRSLAMNHGFQLFPSDVDYSKAFAFLNFTTQSDSGMSFGGKTVPTPEHSLRPHGQLESQPHDLVHDKVGAGGLMSDPISAAQDPIFWLHHANIDRLWKRWLDQGGGRSNPTDTAWLKTPFSFFDENRQQVTMSGKDILDTVNQLHYRYDDDPANVVIPAMFHEMSAIALAAASGTGQFNHLLATTKKKETIQLGTDTCEIALQIDAKAQKVFQEIATAPVIKNRVILNLEGILFEKSSGVSYEVYINLPPDQRPDYQSKYYAGNLGFFHLMPMQMSHDDGAMVDTQDHSGGKRSFDITSNIRMLPTLGKEKYILVTFVMRGLLPPIDLDELSNEVKAALNLAPPSPITVERVTIASE